MPAELASSAHCTRNRQDDVKCRVGRASVLKRVTACSPSSKEIQRGIWMAQTMLGVPRLRLQGI